MTRLVVGPFNRVEGDLEVTLEIAGERVSDARVTAPMYRGFEQILTGKAPQDALVYVPRICGICSVSQSVAAARALAALAGVDTPPNGRIATNLMLAVENLADHLTHFYLFFMPDFTRPVYADRPWHAEASRRFAAQAGEHARRAIAARQRWFTLLGTLGGKWPHTQSIVPGGSSRPIEAAERIRLLARVREFRAFLERQLFATPLERIAALDSEDALHAWRDEAPAEGDLRLFLAIAQDTGLASLGAGPGRYLSYGSWPRDDGTQELPAGLWRADAGSDGAGPGSTLDSGSASGSARGPVGGRLETIDPARIAEDTSHAWLDDGGQPQRHPLQGLTLPAPDKPGAYSWSKAPRLAGEVIETGAIARQLVDGQPLVRDAVARHGGVVYTRVLARLLELARVVPRVEQWLGEIAPRERFHLPATLPDDGEAAGLAEAARGSLGHWLVVRRRRLASYQIVAPTSWNFSPRDADGHPGALELALRDAPVRPGETTPVAVQHVVRSFDPCMVCTVH